MTSPRPRRTNSRLGRPLLAAGVVLAFAMGMLAWSEAENRRRLAEVERLVSSSGGVLLEALGQAVETALVAGWKAEDQAAGRLLDVARLLGRLETAGAIDPGGLDRLASDLRLSGLLFLDGEGRTVMAAAGVPPLPPDMTARLRPVLDGDAPGLVMGHERAEEYGEWGIAAVARRARGGAIVVGMRARDMSDVTDAINAAHLMRAVASSGGLVYAQLLDEAGNVIAGTSEDCGPSGTRPRIDLERPMILDHGRPGRLRIGLSTAAIEAAAAAGRRRLAGVILVVSALAAAVATLVVVRGRAEDLEAESRRTRSLTDAVLEGVGDAVLFVDAEGIIRLVNPAASRLLGRTAAELVGSPCTAAACAGVCRGEGGWACRETEVRAADGTNLTVLATATRIRDEADQVSGTAVVLRDITDLRRLEHEAERARSLAAFGRLAATVAHEVRNPLNAIAMGVQRLEREFTPPGRADEHGRLTRILRAEIDRLNRFVGRFLDAARPPRVAPVEGRLDAVARETVGLLAGEAPPGVMLAVEDGGPVRALFDPAAIRQVIHNLVRNALDAVGERGTVRVAARAEGSGAVLEITDDGPGIPEADLPRLFEVGYTTKAGGHGLGLSIVQRLVSEMRGSVAIESAVGRGTTVRVVLPAAAARAA